MRNDEGFTLLELMIAVAVLGILAGILVYSLQKPANKVHSVSEVTAMFAEFHRAESQYAVEHGVYYSTGSDDTDIFPTTPTNTTQSVTSPPAEWTTLHISPSADNLYCGYVVVAGAATDDIPAFATDFGMTQPAANWYALFAQCNADGDSSKDGTFFASSVDPTLVSRNESF